MAARIVVIGTAPTVDRAVAVGPFTSRKRALDAAGTMDALGYLTELCDLQTVDDLQALDWSDPEGTS